jgi:AcrR family transcriptional regulator
MHDEKRARRSKVVASNARKAILEAIAAFSYNDRFETVSLDCMADHAGLHKMSVYRTFGSPEELVEAYAGWLCEREKQRWHDEAQRSSARPTQHLRKLFVDLAGRMLADGFHGCSLDLLARQFANAAHPVRAMLAVHEHEFRSLLPQLARDSNVVDTGSVADTLMLLCEGAALDLRSRRDSRQVSQRLPELVERVLKTYLRDK